MGFQTYDNILRDQATRKRARKLQTELPMPIDLDSLAHYQKRFKELEEERYDTLHLVDWQIDVLRKALELALGAEKLADLEKLVGQAADLVPLDAKLREKQQEIEAKAAAKTGDIPGQQKLDLEPKGKGKGKVKDDGSVAEPAGPVTTKKLEESEKEKPAAEKSEGLKKLEEAKKPPEKTEQAPAPKPPAANAPPVVATSKQAQPPAPAGVTTGSK